jgi:hypothetical protein
VNKDLVKLVELIKAEYFEVLRVFSEWFEQIHCAGEETKSTAKIRKLTEVTNMYATALENVQWLWLLWLSISTPTFHRKELFLGYAGRLFCMRCFSLEAKAKHGRICADICA